MRTPTFEKKISDPKMFFFYFGCFCRNSVALISTLANHKHKRSCRGEFSAQNCVFLVFPAKKLARFCHAVLDFHEHQGTPPDLFDHARTIAIPGSRHDRQIKIFPVFGQLFILFFRTSPIKSVFFRARHLVVIHTPKEAHSRIFVTGVSFFA